jgi:hypothetical protein
MDQKDFESKRFLTGNVFDHSGSRFPAFPVRLLSCISCIPWFPSMNGRERTQGTQGIFL